MKKISIFFVTVLSLLLVANFASAQPGSNDNSGGTSGTSNNSCPAGSTCLPNPLGTNTSPQVLIGNIINAVMGVVGSIALLMFIFGGLTWMLSGGSAEKVKKGRDILMWSAIGLVVIFSSYAIVYFLITKIK